MSSVNAPIRMNGKGVSVNSLYRGRRFLTKEGQMVKKMYEIEARKQWKKKLMTGPVGVAVYLYFKDNRRRDIDSYLKGLLDSLTGIVYKDDSQITTLYVQKRKNVIDKIEIYAYETDI